MARMADANDIAALDRKAPFAPQCAARGLSLAADEVLRAGALDHRPRPAAALRRALPGGPHARGPEPVADETEQFEPVWVRPADALARHEAGQFFMIFPTIRTLERLQDFASVEAVLAGLRARAAAVDQLPARRPAGGKEARYMEHETPFGELAAGLPRRADRAPAGLADRAARAAAAQRAAPDRPQPRRDDRPRHQQLPGGRPGTPATSPSTPARPTPSTRAAVARGRRATSA
jgi:hypothetical protein